MEPAAKILIVGGVLALAYGFVLGLPLSMTRMRSPHAPRHLVVAHLASIIQAAMMLGLSVAVGPSRLRTGLETLAASLIVAGSALFTAGATVNWIQGIGDHFAERSLGWKLLATSGMLNIPGAAIFVVGVLRGL